MSSWATTNLVTFIVPWQLLKLKDAGDEGATLALKVFCYRIRKYLGAYKAVLGKVDAVVFTAGVGENAPFVRAQVCSNLDPIDIEVDADKNAGAVGKEADITAAGMGTRVLVIPTNEEKLIAQDTYALACP